MLIAALVVAVLVAGVVTLLSSDYFSIKKVRVSGSEHVSEKEIDRARLALLDKNIFRAPLEQVRDRLQSNPWVKEVKFDKDYPHTILIKIIERKPFVQVSDGINYYTVSEDGMVLEELTEPVNLIQVVDLPISKPATGEVINAPEFKDTVTILNSLPENIRKNVLVVSAPSSDRIIFYIGGTEVIYGLAEHIEEKNTVLQEILSREGTSAISIDIRLPTNPIVKTSPES